MVVRKREIWVDGERIEDVTAHPKFGAAPKAWLQSSTGSMPTPTNVCSRIPIAVSVQNVSHMIPHAPARRANLLTFSAVWPTQTFH